MYGWCLKSGCCPPSTDHWDSSILPWIGSGAKPYFLPSVDCVKVEEGLCWFLMSSWGDWLQIPLFPVFYDNVNVINVLTCSSEEFPPSHDGSPRRTRSAHSPILLSLCSVDQAPRRAFSALTVTSRSPVDSGGNWGVKAKACSIGISLRAQVVVESPLSPCLLVFILWVHTPQSFSVLLRISFSPPLCHF